MEEKKKLRYGNEAHRCFYGSLVSNISYVDLLIKSCQNITNGRGEKNSRQWWQIEQYVVNSIDALYFYLGASIAWEHAQQTHL